MKFLIEEVKSYDDICKDFDALVDMLHYNGASHRGGRIPRAIPGCINQINIPDNMRLKCFDAENISNDHTLQMELTYITQEPFESDDIKIFLEEVKSAIQILADRIEFENPFLVVVNVISRDGEEFGKIKTTLKINENLNESNELKKMKNFNGKRQKGLGAFVKLNAGDVEKGMETFNKNTTLNTGSGETSSQSSGEGQGMGESLTEGSMKDIYTDMQEHGGKERYLNLLKRRLQAKEKKWELSNKPSEIKQLEKEIERLKAIISIVDPKPRASIERQEWLKQQIQKLEHELVVDTDDTWDWRKYQRRKIQKYKQELSEIEENK